MKLIAYLNGTYTCEFKATNLIVVCCNLKRGEKCRQAFKRIGGLRALTKVPFMTVTASAPVSVQKDIIQSLSSVDQVSI